MGSANNSRQAPRPQAVSDRLRGFHRLLRKFRNAGSRFAKLFAAGTARAIVCPTQLQSAFTHPACHLRRRPNDQRIVRHVFGHHRAGADKGVSSDRNPTDNRAVGAQRRPFLYQCGFQLSHAGNFAPRIEDIRKDHRRPTEDIIFKSHALIDGDVVLNLDPVPYRGIRTNRDVLTDLAGFSDSGPFRTCETCQTLVPSPTSTPSSIKAESWAKHLREVFAAVRLNGDGRFSSRELPETVATPTGHGGLPHRRSVGATATDGFQEVRDTLLEVVRSFRSQRAGPRHDSRSESGPSIESSEDREEVCPSFPCRQTPPSFGLPRR